MFPSLEAGNYTLDVQAPGFKRQEQTGIHLDVNQNARADVGLQVGQVSETVDARRNGGYQF